MIELFIREAQRGYEEDEGRHQKLSSLENTLKKSLETTFLSKKKLEDDLSNF